MCRVHGLTSCQSFQLVALELSRYVFCIIAVCLFILGLVFSIYQGYGGIKDVKQGRQVGFGLIAIVVSLMVMATVYRSRKDETVGMNNIV